MVNNIEYRSGSTVSQREPIYIDVNKDPRARDQAYLNMYSSRVGAPVIAVDYTTNKTIAASVSSLGSSISSSSSGVATSTDKSVVTGSDIADALASTDPGLGDITSLSATFDQTTQNLNISWQFDTTYQNNKYVKQFEITLVASTTNYDHTFVQYKINTTSADQSYTVLSSDINSWLDTPDTLSSITVVATDGVGHYSNPASINNISMASNLPAPIITVTSVNQGYQVAWTDISSSYPEYQEITIEEVISTSSTDPGTGYSTSYIGKVNPATIITGGLEKRWVRAKFSNKSGRYGSGGYSTAYAVTPTAIVAVNTTPPDEVTSPSATFSNMGTGDDIVVTVTLPQSNYGNSFIIKLIPVAAPSIFGDFYFFPADTSSPKTFTITKSNIYAQFGNYYSSYTGQVISVSSVGNRSNGTSISQFSRTSSLSGVTPTFSVSPSANGYIVTWTNTGGATYADIYEKDSSWGSSNPTDESLRVYSGQSPVTIQSLHYTTRYIKIRFYDDYGNTSSYSSEQSVTPYNPGLLSLISNPVAFQTEGSILAGEYDSNTNTPLYPNVIFNQTGIYAYDSDGNPTTEILNVSSGNTFITTQAQIADWQISDTKIENTLGGTPTANTYTGLSATGTYAFWAGSATSGNSNNLAKFSVKTDGTVHASNINITGGTLTVGSNFSVTNTGALTAESATITGNITSTSGKFTGNVQLYGGSLYAGASPSTGNRTIINSSGIGVFSSTTASTEIVTSPVSKSSTTPGNNTALSDNITLFSTAAQLGGWLVGNDSISSGENQFVLYSGSNPYLQITGTGTNSNKYIKISPPKASSYVSGKTTMIEAGNTSSPNFYVESDGKMTANDATIYGTLVGGSSGSQKTSASDTSHAGFYFGSDGKFIVGGTSNYIKNDNSELTFHGNSYVSSINGATITPIIKFGSDGKLTISNVDFIGDLDSSTVPSTTGNNGFVRTIVSNPSNGNLERGPAIYYGYGQSPDSAGFVGDIWIQY